MKHRLCCVFSSLMSNAIPSLRQPQPQRKKRLAETPEQGQGSVGLTARERDVLQHVIEKQTIRQIAESLHLKTIRTYLHSIFRKTRTSGRTASVWWWTQHVGGV